MYQKIRQVSFKWFLLSMMISASLNSTAQKLNNPNKVGPLGTQVNTLTGNLFLVRTDINVTARAFDINIKFYYNSYNLYQDRGFGKGWGFQYSIMYAADTAGGRVITMGDGREDVYDSISGGGYKTPRGFFGKLAEYQPGKYRLTNPDSILYFFDNPAHKKITRIEEPNGNFISFNYTDSLLTSLVNAAGQTISFTYNAEGRLATIVDANASPSRTYTYTYDGAGNLREVKDPLNGKYKYSYLLNGPMKTLTDKNNNTVNIIYFSNFSASELVGCNKRISFSYDTTLHKTVVTDHLSFGNNQVTTYTYKRSGKISWISALSGNCCGFNMSFEYDDEGNQTKMTDANGNSYEYTYDGNGNMLTAKDPLNQVSSYTYSANYNKITSFKDPKGFLYTLTYDSRGNLTQLVTPGNNVFTATYNANGDIISSTDPKGNTFTYNYDAYGNPFTATGPNGYNATLSFDARGNLLSYTDGRGNTSTAEYDILSRLRKITDPINNSIQFGYDANGNLTSLVNKNNEPSTLAYDASDRLVKVTAPTGNQISFGYDAIDNLVSLKNTLGYETKFNYDTRNRLSNMTDPGTNSYASSYDANGNPTSITMPNGRVVNFTYNALDRITAIHDNSGVIASFVYDQNNNIIKYTNGTGTSVTAAYDSLNRLVKRTDALGNNMVFTYDKNNKVTSVTDRNGFTTLYTYDGLNRIKTFTDNNGSVVTISYDAESNIIELKDQNNNVTAYTYDELNRRKRMTYPDGGFIEFGYDKKGNIISKRQTGGSVITYQYDSLNRVTAMNHPNGQLHNYSYDALGRIISATNNAGTVTLSYDKLSRVVSEAFDGRTTSYSYNVSGRTQTITYPDGTKVIREFDKRNRLIKILKDSIMVAEYAYNNANQPIAKTFANGVTTSLQYDFANRLSSISTGTIQQTAFTYDKEMNKTSVNRLNNPALSEQFTYDNGYRLTNYKRGITGNPPVIENTYAYDAVGNRTSANLNGTNTTYTINSLNQVTTSNGAQNIVFVYDGLGNLTFDGVYHKIYDAQHRLLKDSASPANVIAYTYDALNRRISKTTNGATLKYTYSGLSQIEERDVSNNILNKTVFTNFLSPVLNEKNGSSFYYHQNELNSVEAITDNTGRLTERYHYDAFGRPSRFDSLNNPLLYSIAGNRSGFTGQEYDSASGSYRFFFRNYSPETGTFYQRDLIEYQDGMGMYQYVGNNPANGVDVLGLDCWWSREEMAKMKAITETQKKEFNKTEDTKSKIWDIPVIDHDNIARDVEKTWGYNSTEGAEVFSVENYLLAADGFKNTAKMGMGGLALKSTFSGNWAGVGVGVAGKATLVSVDASSELIFNMGEDPLGSAQKIHDGLSKVERIKLKFKERQFIEHEKYLQEYTEKYGSDRSNWSQEALDVYETHQKAISERQEGCPEGGTQKLPPLTNSPYHTKVRVLRSYDPNLIIGPEGQPDVKWVSVNDRLPYTILYENDSSATAPAKFVRVTTLIESKQDPASFELGSFGFNNQTFEIPSGTSAYYQRLDCRDSMGLFVDIVAGYDQMNNLAFWEFQSIDPVTLLAPEDPLKGFLFMHDSTEANYGHGFVNFSIKPRSSAITLDTIAAKAEIIFDQNEVIPTNIHKNTIDAFSPTSHMTALSSTSTNPIFLAWTGADDAGGCGIDHYTIYVSTDQVNYSVLIPRISRNDTTLTLPPDSNYCFFVLATDRVGNKETLRQNEIQCSYIGPPLPVTWLYFKGKTVVKNNILDWATANEQNSKQFDVERSLNGTTFSKIGTVAAQGNSSQSNNYQYTDPNIDRLNSETMFYRLKQIDMDGNFKYSNIVRLRYTEKNKANTIVYPNPTPGLITILIGDNSLIGSMAVLYDINGRLLESIKITASSQAFDLSRYTNGTYFIRLSNKEILKVIKN